MLAYVSCLTIGTWCKVRSELGILVLWFFFRPLRHASLLRPSSPFGAPGSSHFESGSGWTLQSYITVVFVGNGMMGSTMPCCDGKCYGWGNRATQTTGMAWWVCVEDHMFGFCGSMASETVDPLVTPEAAVWPLAW